jgi:hypothetical protein
MTVGVTAPSEISLKLPNVDYNTCKGSLVGLPEWHHYCKGCYRHRMIEPTCKQRNCPKCQKVHVMELYEKYAPALRRIKTGFGRRWINITLTGFHVPQDMYALFADAYLREAREFLKEHYLGGFVGLEHTKKPDGYYLHVHALVLGDFQDQKKLSDEWGRIVYLQDLRKDKKGRERSKDQQANAALAYVLKYMTKGVELPDEKLKEVKGMRYYSTFGELYAMGLPKITHRCKFCKGEIALASLLDVEMIEEKKMSAGPEVLVLEKEISWPPVRRRKSRIEREAERLEREETSNRMKEYASRLWEGQSLLVGLPLMLKWLLDKNGDPALIVNAGYAI